MYIYIYMYNCFSYSFKSCTLLQLIWISSQRDNIIQFVNFEHIAILNMWDILKCWMFNDIIKENVTAKKCGTVCVWTLLAKFRCPVVCWQTRDWRGRGCFTQSFALSLSPRPCRLLLIPPPRWKNTQILSLGWLVAKQHGQ